MASNPFRTPEFLALFKHWNKVLEKSGHQEVEDFSLPNAPLKAWHNQKWLSNDPHRREALSHYYQLASEVLLFHNFKNELHKKVWELHCEGLSVRKIAIKLNRKRLNKSYVHCIIMQIELDAGLKRGK